MFWDTFNLPWSSWILLGLLLSLLDGIRIAFSLWLILPHCWGSTLAVRFRVLYPGPCVLQGFPTLASGNGGWVNPRKFSTCPFRDQGSNLCLLQCPFLHTYALIGTVLKILFLQLCFLYYSAQQTPATLASLNSQFWLLKLGRLLGSEFPFSVL